MREGITADIVLAHDDPALPSRAIRALIASQPATREVREGEDR